MERAARNGAQALAKGEFQATSVAGREVALYALDRAARSDPAAAHEAWAKVRGKFSDAGPPVRQPARGAPGRASAQSCRQCLVSRSRRCAAECRAARVESACRIARASMARRGARHRRDAGRPGAGSGVALLESARICRVRHERRRHAAVCRHRRRAPFLRTDGGRSARRGDHARQRTAAARRQGAVRIRRARRSAARGQAHRTRPAPGGIAGVAVCRTRPKRRDAAARSRVCPPQRPVRPVDQFRRPHSATARFRAALPDALPGRDRQRRARCPARRSMGVRAGAAGEQVRRRHRVLGRRRGTDAADAADREVGRTTDRTRRFPYAAARRPRNQRAVRNVLSALCARSARRPARACDRGVQCRSGPRAGVAWHGADRRCDLCRNDPVQRDPRLREESPCQRHVLPGAAGAALCRAEGPSGHGNAQRQESGERSRGRPPGGRAK